MLELDVLIQGKWKARIFDSCIVRFLFSNQFLFLMSLWCLLEFIRGRDTLLWSISLLVRLTRLSWIYLHRHFLSYSYAFPYPPCFLDKGGGRLLVWWALVGRWTLQLSLFYCEFLIVDFWKHFRVKKMPSWCFLNIKYKVVQIWKNLKKKKQNNEIFMLKCQNVSTLKINPWQYKPTFWARW